MNFPFIPDTRIDAEAVRLKVAGLGEQRCCDPRVDLEAILFDYLCERDHLSVDLDADLPDEEGDEVLGKTTIEPGRIQVNGRLRPDGGRFRFTLAHEVGHWILHRPLILASAQQGGLFAESQVGSIPSTLNRSITDPNPPREEVQANRFAAALLIDHDQLRNEFTARFGLTGPSQVLREARMFTTSPREQARFLAAFGSTPTLAQFFGVSVEAMAIALQSRKYLPAEDSLFENRT